jgi:hypothetical protein
MDIVELILNSFEEPESLKRFETLKIFVKGIG